MQIDVPDEVDNVFIFVADALRYDFVPDVLTDRWPLLKTVASGVMSPASFATIFTGRFPPEHGVYAFDHRLPEGMPSLFDLTPHPSSLHLEGTIGRLLGIEDDPVHPVSEAEPPFLAVERELVTHAPFGEQFHWPDAQYDSHAEYWRATRGDRARIRSDYKAGADLAAERFLDRIETLEDRGLLERTLVIFTADHGELLGEYGLVGHGNLTCPELVTVPTLFCNDSVDVSGEFMAHVDLYPTIASVFGRTDVDVAGLPGFDLTEGAADDRMVYNEMKQWHGQEWSAWDDDGAHVFSETPYLEKLKWIVAMMLTNDRAPFCRRRPHEVARTAVGRILHDHHVIGTPGFAAGAAEEFCERIRSASIESSRHEIDEESADRLRALGYREDIQ